MFFFLPETDPTHILYRRARRLRAVTANNRFCTEAEEEARLITQGQLLNRITVKPIALNFQEPIVLVLNLYLALVYAMLFAALESFRVVYVEIYGFSSVQEGLTFLAPLIGFELASIAYFFFLYFYQERHFSADGKLRPEERLIPAFVTAFATPIGLFWFGWTSRESIHWIVPVLSGGIIGVASMGAFIAILNYLADGYPSVASTVLAGESSSNASVVMLSRRWAAAKWPYTTLSLTPARQLLRTIYGSRHLSPFHHPAVQDNRSRVGELDMGVHCMLVHTRAILPIPPWLEASDEKQTCSQRLLRQRRPSTRVAAGLRQLRNPHQVSNFDLRQLFRGA